MYNNIGEGQIFQRININDFGDGLLYRDIYLVWYMDLQVNPHARDAWHHHK